MKTKWINTLIVLVVLLSVHLATGAQVTTVQVKGVVQDADTRELLIGVSVITKGSSSGTTTNISGQYSIAVPTGGILRFAYIGYKQVEVKVYKDTVLNISLHPEAVILEDAVVVGHSAKKRSKGSAVAKEVAVDRIEASDDIILYDMAVEVDPVARMPRVTVSPSPSHVPETPTQQKQPAGQLTCGEWNDLRNWDKYVALMQGSDFIAAATNWQITTEQGYAFEVVDANKQPLNGATLQLYAANKQLLWTSRTDNQGRAQVWVNATGARQATMPAKVVVQYADQRVEVTDLSPITKQVNKVSLKVKPTQSNQVDVLMMVDATGSMGDELEFIKSELYNVLERVKAGNTSLQFRTGAVYYRDLTDEYVTKVSPFTGEIMHTLNFIAKQRADGGGDYPEAVDSALYDALHRLQWNPDARARLLFMVLDAPPHLTPAVVAKMHERIRLASEMGVRIIPVVGSGIGKQDEFLFRSWAVLTNGTYVFLTDHSGIGNSHLAPSIPDYKIELLNDALVRIITEYTK